MDKRRTFTEEFKPFGDQASIIARKQHCANSRRFRARSTLTRWIRLSRDKGGAAFPGHGNIALIPQEAEI